MKRLIAAAALGLLAVAAPARAEDGKELYGKKCKICHGADGAGAIPNAKAVNLRTTKLSEAELVKTIEAGKPPKMLPVKGLTPEQEKAIAAYVKAGLQ